MAKSKVRAITPQEADQLLRGMALWEAPDVEAFLRKAKKMLAGKRTKKLSSEETELFLTINKAVLSPTEWKLYKRLHEKYDNGNISADERMEYSRFAERLEVHGMERLKSLIQLAKLRQTTLPQLMSDLGIDNVTPDVEKEAE